MECNLVSWLSSIYVGLHVFPPALRETDTLPSVKNTWQRAHGKILAGKGVFAKCFLSGTRQRLYGVPTLGKEKNKKSQKK